MFLPIGDTPNPPNFRPWVTWALMAVNIAVYLLLTLPLSFQGVSPDDPLLQEYLRALAGRLPPNVPLEAVLSGLNGWDLFVFEHGYKPGAGAVDDLFTSMFMHAGFMHLAGNMLFLWIYGDNVEHHLGRGTFLVAYVGTGIIATLSFAAFAGDAMIPLVGASGAISGVLGLYFVLFPRNKVKVFVAFFPIIFTAILVPARIVLGIFLIIDNVLPALVSTASTGVAYGAHIGGFIGGLALAWVGERVGWGLGGVKSALGAREKPREKPEAPRFTVAQAEDALVAAVRRRDRAEALERARFLSPSQILEKLGGDALVLAEWMAEAGEPIAAMTLLRRALSAGRGQVDQARVYLTLGLVRLQQGQPTAAYQHILSALDHDPDEETEVRAREALRLITPN